ncbi:unnamed protein product [Leuciscus chuanchicus]
MDKFVIRPPQKRQSPTDSPTAAGSNDPDILDPGEETPTKSVRGASSASNTNTGNTKCRKYQDSYLDYGFISFSRSKDSLPQPQCIFCAKVLANECMRPSKLIRHFQTTHPQYRDKPRAFFERKAKELTLSQNEMREITATDKKLLKRPDLAEFLDDDKWLAQLSYLSDIFGEINKLNRAMQGANINTVVQHERVEAFKRKLHMWKTRVSSGISDMFEHTHAFIADRHLNFKIIQRQITVHLSKVLEKFDSYFPALTEEQAADFLWIRNPFTENIEAKLPATLPSRLLEELIEISSDASLRARFKQISQIPARLDGAQHAGRHHNSSYKQIGHGQRQDEVVSWCVKLLETNDRYDHQQVSYDCDNRRDTKKDVE